MQYNFQHLHVVLGQNKMKKFNTVTSMDGR